MSVEFGIVIPARIGSSRLPRKPLVDLAGKPMIVRVCENARRSGAAFVVVAADDERIVRAVEAAGGTAVLTRTDHLSGTDRVAEVIERRGLAEDSIIVNVQGDEPLLDPKYIRLVAHALAEHPAAGIATLASPICSVSELFDPNVVKVVTNAHGMAMLFSRAPVPWVREAFSAGTIPTTIPKAHGFLRHVGLYAYTARALRQLARSAPTGLELAESLEQLRALWLGIPIHVHIAPNVPAGGVDTEADLRRVKRLLRAAAEGAND